MYYVIYITQDSILNFKYFKVFNFVISINIWVPSMTDLKSNGSLIFQKCKLFIIYYLLFTTLTISYLY